MTGMTPFDLTPQQRQEREAGFREALKSLYQQIDAWASTGLLGSGVIAQREEMTLDGGQNGPFDTERLRISAGRALLVLEPTTLTPPGAYGEVRLVGAGQDDVLRLGERGAWTCGPLSQAPGVPLDPDLLRQFLNGEAVGG